MPENTKNQSQIANRKSQITWLLFAVVIVFIYFFGLDVPLLGPDEPRYTQIAREMYERGDWITPKLGGYDWFEKPALLYWLQIFFFNLFGVSEFSARIGSALFGLGTVFSLWVLGKNYPQINTDAHGLEGEKSMIEDQKSKTEFANYLMLVAGSTVGLIAFARGASFDIILTFPIAASLVGFFIFDQASKKSGFTFYLSLFAFYFFMGVAVLAKGLVGFVFPFAIVAFYHVLSLKLPSKTFLVSLLWGTIVAVAVALSWYLPMYQANGWKFIDEFIIQHHFQRYTSNKYQHPQPFWFFWVILPLMTIPWILFFFAGIWSFLKGVFHRRDEKSQNINGKTPFFAFLPFTFYLQNPLLIFSFAWMLVPLVFFSASGSKLPGYILPALPAAIIFAGECVFRFARKSAKRDLLVKGVAAATFAVVIVILEFFLLDYASHETTKNLIAAADAKGYKNVKLVNLYTVSHNLEFYAPDKAVRDENGKLKRYADYLELVKDAKNQPDQQFLVLVQEKDLDHLKKENVIADLEVIGTNGEHALILVKSKL